MSGVAFLTNNFVHKAFPLEPDGVAYYRCVLPSTALEGRVLVGPPAWTGSEGFGAINGPNDAAFFFDTVVLKNLFTREVPFQMKAAQGLGQKIFIDVDDLYDDLPDWHPASKALDPSTNKLRNTDLFNEVLMQADGIITSTQFLFDRYSQMRNNVHLVRNAVNPSVITQRKSSSAKPLIGWAGTLIKRPADIESLRWWLPEFLETHDLNFHHSGEIEDLSVRTFA